MALPVFIPYAPDRQGDALRQRKVADVELLRLEAGEPVGDGLELLADRLKVAFIYVSQDRRDQSHPRIPHAEVGARRAELKFQIFLASVGYLTYAMIFPARGVVAS